MPVGSSIEKSYVERDEWLVEHEELGCWSNWTLDEPGARQGKLREGRRFVSDEGLKQDVDSRKLLSSSNVCSIVASEIDAGFGTCAEVLRR